MKKKILSILLTLVMVIGMLPAASLTAYAASGTSGGGFTLGGDTADWNVKISDAGVLSWNAQAGATTYNLEFYRSLTDAYPDESINGVTTNSVDLKAAFEALPMDHCSYYFKIVAPGAGSTGSGSHDTPDMSIGYVSSLPKLSEPQNLTWDGYTAKWESVPGATGYIFNLYNAYGLKQAKNIETDKTALNFYAEDGWWFTVEATRDGYRNSNAAESPKYGASLSGGGITLSGDTADWNVQISDAGVLSWNAQAGATTYNLEFYRSAADAYPDESINGVTTCSVDLKAAFEALAMDHCSYYFKIVAPGAGSTGSGSHDTPDMSIGYVSSLPKLSEPQKLKYGATGQSWESVPGATGYIFTLYNAYGVKQAKNIETDKTALNFYAEDGWWFTVQATADGYRNSNAAESPKYFRGTVNVDATWSGTPADATTSTIGAEVTETKWYKQSGSGWTQLTSSNTISAGGTYRCEVTIAAAADYQLMDGYTVKISGIDATKGSGNTWYRDVTFTGYSDYVEVNDIDLPEAYTNPDFTYDTSDVAPSQKHWDVVLVEWFECDKDGRKLSDALPADYVFDKDSYYRVEVTVVPETNWQFHGSALGIYINDKAAMPLYNWNEAYPDSVTGYVVYNTADIEGDYELFVYDNSLSGSAKNIYIKDGQYLGSDATAPSNTKPASGGYAYYEDGVLELNGYNNDQAHFIFEERALELWLIGDNTIGAIYDNEGGFSSQLDTREGNLVIDAADGGKLVIASNPLDAYANIQVKDLYFNGGELTSCLANDTYGAAVQLNGGNLYLENGYVAYVSDTNDFASATKWDGATNLNTYDCVWIVKEKTETTLTGSATDGIKVKVEKLSGSATLIVAQYEGGKMVDVQTKAVTADGTYTMNELTHKTGCTYKAFLVNSTSYAPLCEADEF